MRQNTFNDTRTRSCSRGVDDCCTDETRKEQKLSGIRAEKKKQGKPQENRTQGVDS